MLKLGVIGYGYWGPNIVRNFSVHADCKVVAICDKSPKAVAQVSRNAKWLLKALDTLRRELKTAGSTDGRQER